MRPPAREPTGRQLGSSRNVGQPAAGGLEWNRYRRERHVFVAKSIMQVCTRPDRMMVRAALEWLDAGVLATPAAARNTALASLGRN